MARKASTTFPQWRCSPRCHPGCCRLPMPPPRLRAPTASAVTPRLPHCSLAPPSVVPPPCPFMRPAPLRRSSRPPRKFNATIAGSERMTCCARTAQESRSGWGSCGRCCSRRPCRHCRHHQAPPRCLRGRNVGGFFRPVSVPGVLVRAAPHGRMAPCKGARNTWRFSAKTPSTHGDV